MFQRQQLTILCCKLTQCSVHNICRHRGNKLVRDAAGTRPGFACNFHGWGYTTEGKLRLITDEKEFRERNWPIAEARGKWMLLRDKLIEDAKIEATDADYEKLAEEESAKYGLPKDNLLKYYHKYDTIKNRIVSEKLGALLRERVKITEKVIEN